MIFTAPWIIPVSSPPLKNAWVQLKGDSITALGTGTPPTHSPEETIDFPNAALMPGLINAHAHIEFSGTSHPQNSFAAWARSVQNAQQNKSKTDLENAWQQNCQQLLKTGSTSVVNHCNATPENINSIHPRLFQIAEIVGSSATTATQTYQYACEQQLHRSRQPNSPFESFNISPTSLYAVAPLVLEQFFKNRSPHQLLSIHVKESREEHELFNHGTGPLSQLVKDRGGLMWLKDPIGWLAEHEGLTEKTLIIHGNYLNETDQNLLKQSQASVVHCPGSHQYFKHEPFPLAELLSEDINICLGTDSLASNTELSMLQEIRWLIARYPEISYPQALELATINGAQALGVAEQRGQLKATFDADIIAIPLSDPNDWHSAVEATEVFMNCVAGKILYSTPQIATR